MLFFLLLRFLNLTEPQELARMEQESWLESDENYAKWSSQKITATEKRTLITWWFGEAYKKLCGELEMGLCALWDFTTSLS